ncbi:MAG: hypothetical protein BGO12_00400 [Verrucomicrobia bacterium 61-8]|nr:MAG: hypothetical protein BGO12_00400 [Verrucomicrobia bacterium 61-8]
MSYDLYITSPITLEQFTRYFGERPGYSLEGTQAWYSNEETGVYFHFDHNSQPVEEDDEIAHSVVFIINLFRPGYFILEAEPEVTRFVKTFDCSVYDPQNFGVEDSRYTAEALVRGWKHGNEFGYSAILDTDDAPAQILTRPAKELESVWAWNFHANVRMEAAQKDIFIPHIFYLLLENELRSACVWPDAISTLIPGVDLLIIPRKQLAPRAFFFGKQREDRCIISFAEALPIIAPYRTDEYEIPAFELPSPATPAAMKNFVKALSPDTTQPARLPMDQIYDRELAVKYLRK